ncbi:MAG: glycosyltransferase family 4 protein [Bacteroidetes bacterium]|nr:glycosyltransferase family 4 protein [Bacteroidota bacterium]
MKITMVSCQHFTSGIGHYGVELASEIRKTQPDLELFKLSKPGHEDDSWFSNSWIRPIRYRSLRNLHPYVLPIYIRKALVGTHSDIYHAHWFQSGLALTLGYSKKTVITMHDVSLLHVKEGSSLFADYYSWSINRFKKLGIPLIVVSEAAKQDTIEYAGYPEKLVFPIHNGINFNQFYPAKNKINKSTFTLIYTGGLGQRKNVKKLLDVMKVLENKYDFIEMKLAGSHPERTPFPSYAAQLGLKRTSFTGFIPDDQLTTFYQNGDLLIYPSEYEGFGFAPLEAMACGIPVISGTGGALKETAGSGAWLSGLETEELAEKAIKIIEDSQFRNDLIKKGSDWVKQFTWEKSAEKTLDVFQKERS